VFQTIDQSKKCLNAFEQDSTLVAVVELSQKSWLVAGIVPGVDRHPLKKFDADENRLFALIQRWKQEAIKAGREVKRIVVAFEAGRDGFWLARWLQASGIEVCVIHPTSVSVPSVGRSAAAFTAQRHRSPRAGPRRSEPGDCRSPQKRPGNSAH
jgi:transposase